MRARRNLMCYGGHQMRANLLLRLAARSTPCTAGVLMRAVLNSTSACAETEFGARWRATLSDQLTAMPVLSAPIVTMPYELATALRIKP
jgi:hypothetical protein